MLVVHARRIALDAGRVQSECHRARPARRLFAIFERVAQGLSPRRTRRCRRRSKRVHPSAPSRTTSRGCSRRRRRRRSTTSNAALARLSGLRPRPPGALGHLTLRRETRSGARRRRRRSPQLAVVAARAFSRGPFPDLRQEVRRGVRHVQGAGRRGADGDGAEQHRRRPAAHGARRRRPACRRTTSTRRRRRTPTTRTTSSISATPTGSSATRRRRSTGCAKAVRRNPTDGDAHFVLGAALAAAGNLTESAREKELARRLSSTYEEWDRRPAADAVPKGLERLKSDVELPHARRIETTLATTGQRDQQELAEFYLDRGRRLFDQRTIARPRRAESRAVPVALSRRRPLLLGRIHLRGGRAREAIDALKISLWSAETAEGARRARPRRTSRRRTSASARTESARALALDPSSSEAQIGSSTC